ncbi:Uncharacterized protein HZ326_3273 [Fusarium oxysporum f. sp. albedinis]|nr:Uncharacterized protein HZ326_3273 [Fusarium oxysporum f. sp. albedinis]
MKEFCLKLNNLSSSGSLSAASSRSSLISDNSGTLTEPESSVHKMVNFALALIPEETLQATIDKFLKTKWHDTLNQRAYDQHPYLSKQGLQAAPRIAGRCD